MKKFVVEYEDISEFDEDVDCEDVLKFLSSESHQKVLTNWKVTELPAMPEVKMVETGILMCPAEIAGLSYVKSIEFDSVHGEKRLCCYNENIGKRIRLSEFIFPREFYRDIQKTWDFASIPVGAVIEVDNYTDVGIVVKNEAGFISLQCNKNDSHHRRWVINTNNANITSVSILKLPKDGEKL